MFVNTLVSEPAGDLNFAHSGTCQQHEFPFWQLPLLIFKQSSLFAFSDGLLPRNIGVPSAPPSSPPFPLHFEFRCGRRTWTKSSLSFAFLVCTCLNVHESPNEHSPFVIQRMQFPLSELTCALLSLGGLLQVCPHLDCSLWSENPSLYSRDVFGPLPSMIIFLVASVVSWA